MSSVNKVILIGNVGSDPEIRYTPSGSVVCFFSIATTEKYQDKATNERKEITEWHKIVSFNKLAEITKDFIKKGYKVYIEGSLKSNKYTNKDMVEKISFEIQAKEIKILSSKKNDDSIGSVVSNTNTPSIKQDITYLQDDIPF